jgi:hypothetical protein
MTMSEQTLRDAGLEELVTRIYRLCVFSLQHQHRLFANGRACVGALGESLDDDAAIAALAVGSSRY